MKVCSSCKNEKGLECFSKGKNICKQCCSEYFKEWEKKKEKNPDDLPSEKKCSICKEVKDISEFYIRKKTKKPVARCKTCNYSLSRKSYGKLTKEEKDERNRQHTVWVREQINKGNFKVFVRSKLNSYKHSAKTKGVPFDLSVSFLVDLLKRQEQRCYYTGVDLTFESFRGLGKRRITLVNSHNQASLDRKDPQKGYVEGNVVWAAWIVNTCKNMLSEKEFYRFCATVVQNKYGMCQRCQDDVFGE